MKICLIGDSQLGALKQALDEGLVGPGGHHISFFAAVAGKALGFRFVDNTIQPGAVDDIRFATEGAFSQISPADFDALVFYGTGLEFGKWVRADDGTPQTEAAYTAAFLAACVETKIARSQCLKLAEAVASSEGWPALRLVCPAPARCAPPARLPDGQLPENPHEGVPLISASALNACAARLCGRVGAGYLPQPTATLTADFYTRAAFSAGSRRFIPGQPAHPVTERNHMNASYGALMLRDILAALP